MIDVESEKSLPRRCPEFGGGYAAVKVGVRRNHRLWKIEQSITPRTLMLVGIASSKEASAPAAASMMTATMSSATLAALPFLGGVAAIGGHVKMPTRDLGSDDILVARDFVGIDFAVVVDVQKREKSIRVRLHLLKGQLPIVVTVRLAEPVGERIVVAAARPERLAHRADE